MIVLAGFFIFCCVFKLKIGDGWEAPLEVHIEQELDSGVLTCPVEKFALLCKIWRKYMFFKEGFMAKFMNMNEPAVVSFHIWGKFN